MGDEIYSLAVVAGFEDFYMLNSASVSLNLEIANDKSTDFTARSQANIRDFSSISYLLFKHASMDHRRIVALLCGVIHQTLVVSLVLTVHSGQSGFTGFTLIPTSFYLIFMIFLNPLFFVLNALFRRTESQEFLHRIYGQYRCNYNGFNRIFQDIPKTCLIGFLDFLLFYMPFALGENYILSSAEGKTTSIEAL
mmetsp:Transcript_14892/g.23076  ORF Transcript_14892/g.23076 Transcript_14892/m.23076 type:complete len:194 (-) Transcript_14892:1424-2005(-)